MAEKAKEAGITTHEVEMNGAFNWLLKHGAHFDILHAQSSGAQTAAVTSKHFHKRPVVYTRRVDFRIKGALSKWKYRITDKLVAISEAIREIMEGQGLRDIDVVPSVVVPKVLDRERAKATLEEQGIAGKKVIGTVAALVQHKDPLTMVAAIAQLAKKRDDFIFLHFGAGKMQEEAKAKVMELGLEGIYRFMGHVVNVEDFYSVFDVFVMSSEEEGLGSSVLDAFQYGVPVATTNAGGLKETVEGRGLLCAVKDHEALAVNVERLLDDAALAADLKAKALAAVKAHYDLGAATQQYMALYQRLQESRSGDQ